MVVSVAALVSVEPPVLGAVVGAAVVAAPLVGVAAPVELVVVSPTATCDRYHESNDRQQRDGYEQEPFSTCFSLPKFCGVVLESVRDPLTLSE